MRLYDERLELTKQDSQMAKGMAILAMVALHLFCRLGQLPYEPLVYIGQIPLVYYLGLFGDLCVPVYCFCSGYAHFLLQEKSGNDYRKGIPRKAISFLRNYWMVLLLFSGIGILLGEEGIPGTLPEFLGNFFLFRLSYNGAWWFVTTYLLLLIGSPVLITVAKKCHSLLLVAASGAVYLAAYMLRYNFPVSFPNKFADWLWNQLILFGTSQLGYVLGMVFRKERLISRAKGLLEDKAWGMAAVHLLPAVLFWVHCLVQSAVVAPITGIGTLTCFILWKKPLWVERVFLFFGKHSTNIWLVHMFFYAVLFRDLVFAAKYPILIYLLMLGLCVGVSQIIFSVSRFLKRVQIQL